ncbi:GntR family transcriptional regulator [Anaerotruncus massiliensis (ex Liu et al. 2021)]|uniref:GntR family transcriptional regulator n=2 Tax=Anaerotruncus TaxID=244127 RepID=A0A498CTK8_9FIRM|nr:MULTISPECIES: GntR family transcriptional regulator [Anaerotruncus]MBC3937355.1 GntR family transcriptional regulator [Anaerotruncus massiliensis (ex Togo et al. 2019)]RLL14482.1 GntR family transcriptional regulator [Anaerotruncus massiliensis (ex Liu et al. 2021)]
MEFDVGVYSLIYEYYEARILCGYYRFDDRLPSIPRISAFFQVAPATVRSALSLLEEKGYVAVNAKKAARVTYRPDPARYRENAALYFVPRESGLADMTQGGRLILEPCWEAGLLQWGKSSWQELLLRLDTDRPGFLSMRIAFYILALSALDNRLILNLYWEIIRYLRFPLLIERPVVDVESARGGPNPENVFAQINAVLVNTYAQASSELFAFIQKAREEYSLENAPQIPFRWHIYRQRPQMRYSLASRVIREIQRGTYSAGDSLPSLSEMSRRYGVSLNTVRRMLSLLNEFGITESHKGRRASVRMEPVRFDLTKPEHQNGLRLYLEALQLLELTIPRVMRFTWEAVPSERLKQMQADLAVLRQKETCELCFEVGFTFVTEQCPLAVVRECYGQLLELLTWGYPLAMLRLGTRAIHPEYADFVERLERCLRENDPEGFSLAWKTQMEREYGLVRAFIEKERAGREAALAGPA